MFREIKTSQAKITLPIDLRDENWQGLILLIKKIITEVK
jgi:hypothetical protein